MEAIDELLTRDIIRATDVPRRFRFRHPIVRRAVYETAPARLANRSPRASGRGAGGARGRRRHPSASHRHLGQGRATRRPWPHWRRQVGSPRPARRRSRCDGYRGRCGCCPTMRRSENESSCSLSNATSLAATGRFDDAHAAILEGLAASFPLRKPRSSSSCSTTCSRIEHLLGRHDQAHARLIDRAGVAARRAGADAVGLMIELAGDAVFRLQYTAGQDWAATSHSCLSSHGRSRF